MVQVFSPAGVAPSSRELPEAVVSEGDQVFLETDLPEGFLDTQVAKPEQSLRPFGVPISSYLNGLYLTGVISGYYCGGAPASTPSPPARASWQPRSRRYRPE